MWGTDGKVHAGGPGTIQKKGHKLETEGDTKFCT